jgi:hypothetical protein
LQNSSIVLNGQRRDDGTVEKKQRGLNRIDGLPLLKGPTMVALLVLLSATAVAAIAGALTLTVTDGYGRVPQRTHVRAI